VTIDERYAYKIKAVTTLGESYISSAIEATPGYAPQNVTISPISADNDDEVEATVSWIEPNDATGIVGYRVWASGYEPVILDNHTFNCSSVNFGKAVVRVDSIYEDGRIVYGNEVEVGRPMGSCIFDWSDYLLFFGLSIGAILLIALVVVGVNRRRKKR